MPTNPRTLWSRLYAWLSLSEPPVSADLLFVFAGKMDRKAYALDLLRQGLAPAALVSVGRFEIRRFSKMDLPVPLDLLQIAQSVPPPQRHYFVHFANHSVEYELVAIRRFGTLSEVRALARRLASHPQVQSLLLISNATHLRRIRLCCRTLLNPDLGITYVAAPEPPLAPSASPLFPEASADDDSAADTHRPRALFRELSKLVIYWFLLKFR